MTEQQFKILCRAYWPDCYFSGGGRSLMCYPNGLPSNDGVQLYKGNVFGWSTHTMFKETNELKPEDIVKEIYDNRTV